MLAEVRHPLDPMETARPATRRCPSRVPGGQSMDPKRSQVSLYRFFSGLAEFTFQTRLGIADPPLVDYIAVLLTRFIHRDAIYKVRNPAGRPLEEVAEMLVEAEARIGDARREVHRHIGDFALFWTGLFPETLRRLQKQPRLDYFVDYCEQGK